MSKPKNERYTVAVDFDGVLHEYSSEWTATHTIPDPPVAGAIEWLAEVIQKMDVVIFSMRCRTWRGRKALRAWLKKHAGMLWYPSPAASHGIEDVRLSFTKPKALVYIDDRAFRFSGAFPTVTEIHRMKPWNKGGAPTRPASPALDRLKEEAEHLEEMAKVPGSFHTISFSNSWDMGYRDDFISVWIDGKVENAGRGTTFHEALSRALRIIEEL